jgi:Protein of unknown function, DUF481
MMLFFCKSSKVVSFPILLHPQNKADSSKNTLSKALVWIKNNSNAKYSIDGNYSSGNVNRLLIANRLNFNYHYKIYEANLNASYIYGKQNLIKTENDYFYGLTYTLFHKSTVYVWGTVSTEKSFSRGISERDIAGTGLGFNLVKKEKAKQLSITYGLMYENTNFTRLNDIETFRLSFRLKGKHSLIKNKLYFTHESFVQPSITDAENYKYRTLLNLEIPINKHLNLKSSYSHVFENVINPGKKKEDNNLTFGFSFNY